VGHVGTKALRGRCAASHASRFARGGGASPRRRPSFLWNYLCDDNESINNLQAEFNDTTRVAHRGEAPPRVAKQRVAWLAAQTPLRFVKHIYTQTSTPSTNPYDSN
jgi:hypothetical protein